MLGYDTIAVGVKVDENLVQHLLCAYLLKLKLLGPRVNDVLEVLLIQHFANMRLRTLLATAVLVGNELDQDGLRTRLDHLMEAVRVVRLFEVWKYYTFGGACVRRSAYLRLGYLDLLKQAQHAAQLHQHDLADDVHLLELQFKHGLVDLNEAVLLDASEDFLSLPEGSLIRQVVLQRLLSRWRHALILSGDQG